MRKPLAHPRKVARHQNESALHTQGIESARYFSEWDRYGTPGNDSLQWEPIVKALKSIKYTGDVVIESFTTDVKVIARAAAIWRRMEPTRDEIAVKGLKNLKKAFGA